MSEHIANSYNWRATQFGSIASYIKSEIEEGALVESDVIDWLIVLEDAEMGEHKQRNEILEQIRIAQVLPA